MTGRARALAVEDRLASSSVACRRDTSARLGERPEIGDDLHRLRFGDIVRRHRGVRDAATNDADQFLVRQRSTELTTPEIDARNLVAVGPVAVCAGVPEGTAPIFDIESCGVLSEKGAARGKMAGRDEHENREGGPHKS